MVNVGNAQGALPEDTRLVLEYDPARIEEELSMLRSEVNKKLWIAIGLSLVLLLIGAGYVIWAYKRNKLLQRQAQKADRMAYVGTLASGLAHEIRNPLNSMNMNVQLIQEELLEQRPSGDVPELYNMLDATRKEILRLERLVSSFLMFARPTQLQTHPTHINELLGDTLKFLEPEIQKSGIELKTNFDEGLPQIDVDENQLRQALLNIIQNGIQVLQPHKMLEIRTHRQNGNKVAVTVRDEGPGISKEEQKNIFKVFYSTRRGGTGLGLPIAQRIAELHRGDIEVESTPGEGTMFTLVLPTASGAAS
jgi:signal transduction histidine kinase